jgi:hypothetical protein
MAMRMSYLAFALVALVQGCANDPGAATEKPTGDIEVVADCVYRKAGTLAASSSPIQRTITWNKRRTAADIVVRDSNRLLETHHIIQTGDSVEISSEVAHAEPDVQTAAARNSKMTSACLDEGGL